MNKVHIVIINRVMYKVIVYSKYRSTESFWNAPTIMCKHNEKNDKILQESSISYVYGNG